MTTTNGYPAYSVDHWTQQYQVISFPTGRAVKVKPVDVLTFMTGQDGVINPLLSDLFQQRQNLDDAQMTPEDLIGLGDLLNNICLAVIIEPPLKEQGHNLPDSQMISVNDITFPEKMIILTEMMGGSELDDLSKFSIQPETGVVSP